MSIDSKRILSWIFFAVGIFAFSIIFNTIGLIFGLQIREETGSSAALIANAVALIIWAISFFVMW